MTISKKSIIILVVSTAVYSFYIYDISRNPPGFYIDETLASFNAYRLNQTGQGEFGHTLPLYFPVLKIPPPHDYLGWVDPVQIYTLAGLYFIFPPSYLLPRLLSATAMFLACLLLGRLATRISGSVAVGAITTFTAIAAPWLFETGRLAFGASLYPFAVAVLLTSVYSILDKQRWPLANIAAVGASLALVTYTYSIGRLLGPLLAFGLIVFATSMPKFKDVFKTWIVYGVTLIPMMIFHFTNPGALAGRFQMTVGIAGPGKGYYEIILEFLRNYLANISPYRMLFEGDPNLRHHIFGTGAMYIPTLLLSVAGIVLVLVLYNKSAWWRYVLFGLAASVIPASLTRDQFHMLRLIAVPVFLITLTIPATMWLVASAKDGTAGIEGEIQEGARADAGKDAKRWTGLRRGVLAFLIAFTVFQAVSFQFTFRKDGPGRGVWFDESYPRLLKTALSMSERPIYLVDGYWGQAYAHAYWYAIVNKLDPSIFVHVEPGKVPPPGSIVISSEDKCVSCEMIRKDDPFLLYRQRPQVLMAR